MFNNYQENINCSEAIDSTKNTANLSGIFADAQENISSYNSYIDALRVIIESCRNVGLQQGPSSLINIPDENATDEEILSWSLNCINDLRRQTVKANKQLDLHWGNKSEKSTIKKSEKLIKKIEKNNPNVITESEYKNRKGYLTKQLVDLKDQLNTLLNDSRMTKIKVDKLCDLINKTEHLIEELDKKTKIKDPEPDNNNNNDKNNKNNDDSDSKKPEPHHDDKKDKLNNGNDELDDKEENGNSQYDVSNKFLNEHGDDINEENKKIDENLNNGKKEIKKNKIKGNTVGSKGNITITPGTIIEPRRNYADENHNLNREIGRSVEIYSQNSQTVVETVSKVIPAVDDYGNKYEINPSTTTDLVIRQNGNIVGVADDPILNPLSSSEKEELDKLFIYWTYDLSPIYPLLDYIDGQIVIAPLEMYGNAGIILGARPIFPKYKISEGVAIDILCSFLILNTSKSKIAKYYSLKSPVYNSRQDVTRIINLLAILLHGTVICNKEVVLKSCRTLHCDETHIVCLNLRNQNEDDNEKRQKSYIWCFVTGKHEQIKGVIYYPAETRKIEEFLLGLGCTKNDDGTYNITELAIENLIADCYQAYPSAKKILEDGLPHKINLSGCYAHLRRKFVDALKQLGLWKIVKQALKGDVKDFWKRFNELLSKDDRHLSNEVYKIVEATFILELMLSLERDFAFLTKDQVEERRQRLSLPLLDLFYSCISFIYENTNYVVEDKMSDGVQKYKGDKVTPYVSAIVYALNNKEYFYNALSDGDVDLTNNLCELFLRSISIQRSVMEFLFSKIGFKCYADLKTLEGMCEINNVNIFVYMAWVIANKKLRLENYIKELNGKKILNDEEISHKEIINIFFTEKDTNGKQVSMPNEQISNAFALVSEDGLDVNSFRRLCDKEMARSKVIF